MHQLYIIMDLLWHFHTRTQNISILVFLLQFSCPLPTPFLPDKSPGHCYSYMGDWGTILKEWIPHWPRLREPRKGLCVLFCPCTWQTWITVLVENTSPYSVKCFAVSMFSCDFFIFNYVEGCVCACVCYSVISREISFWWVWRSQTAGALWSIAKCSSM